MKKLFKLILVTGCCLMIYGCSQKWYDARNINRMQSYMPRYQPEASALANQLWPCFKGPLRSDTVTTLGKADTSISISLLDTAWSRSWSAGSLTLADSNAAMQFDHSKPITITKTIKIPVIKTVIDTVVDNRNEATLTLQLKGASDNLVKATTQLADKTKSCKTWMWIAIGCIVLIVVFVAIWVYKTFFTGGGVVKTAAKLL